MVVCVECVGIFFGIDLPFIGILSTLLVSMFRKVLYLVLLPIVAMMIIIHTKGKGAVKTIWWYVYWTTIIYFIIGVGRILWTWWDSGASP